MTTGTLGTEEIQKAVAQLVEIVEDVESKRTPESAGGKKVTWTEGVSLVLTDSGKLFKIVNAGGLILAEIKDLESEEALPIITAFKALYSPRNPFTEPFAVKCLEAGLKGKEAGEIFVQLRQWEKDNPKDIV